MNLFHFIALASASVLLSYITIRLGGRTALSEYPWLALAWVLLVFTIGRVADREGLSPRPEQELDRDRRIHSAWGWTVGLLILIGLVWLIFISPYAALLRQLLGYEP
ncbi:MAG: hypothetical protein IT210_05330 [Armatimonadetes bacterium]|nr:hypothetical protein [Armatimonadota bacterium]